VMYLYKRSMYARNTTGRKATSRLGESGIPKRQ
jgi:hypothetical protein